MHLKFYVLLDLWTYLFRFYIMSQMFPKIHTLISSSKENNISAVARNMDASHVFAGQAILLIVRDGTRDMECDQRGESERPSKKPPTLFQPSCFVGGGVWKILFFFVFLSVKVCLFVCKCKLVEFVYLV